MFRHETKNSFVVFSLTFALGSLATLIDIRSDHSGSETPIVAEVRTMPKIVHPSSPSKRSTLCTEAKPEVEFRSTEVLLAEISELSERVRRLENKFLRKKEKNNKSGSDKDPAIIKLKADILELKIKIDTRRIYIEQRKRFGESGPARYQDLLHRENCLSY